VTRVLVDQIRRFARADSNVLIAEAARMLGNQPQGAVGEA
jgi:hypothetical protein